MTKQEKRYRQWCREGCACQGCSYDGTTAGPYFNGLCNGQAVIVSALWCPHCRVYLDVAVLLAKRNKWECPACHCSPASRKHCPACQRKAERARNDKVKARAEAEKERKQGQFPSPCSQRGCWHLASPGQLTCVYHGGVAQPDRRLQFQAAVRRITARPMTLEEEIVILRSKVDPAVEAEMQVRCRAHNLPPVIGTLYTKLGILPATQRRYDKRRRKWRRKQRP